MDDTHQANTDYDPSRFAHLNVSQSGLVVDVSDEDDPVLLKPDGEQVDTWREGYPYPERLSREVYDREKRLLQIELLKLQNWVKSSKESS